MPRLNFISLLLLASFTTRAQYYYADNDSLSFIVQIIGKNDSLDGFKFKILNKSASNIYFGNEAGLKDNAYINVFGNNLYIRCGGIFPEAYDRSTDDIQIELKRINAHDSLIFYKRAPTCVSNPIRKFTLLEFSGMYKSFCIDYIINNKPSFNLGSSMDYKKYLGKKSRLLFHVPPDIIKN